MTGKTEKHIYYHLDKRALTILNRIKILRINPLRAIDGLLLLFIQEGVFPSKFIKSSNRWKKGMPTTNVRIPVNQDILLKIKHIENNKYSIETIIQDMLMVFRLSGYKIPTDYHNMK